MSAQSAAADSTTTKKAARWAAMAVFVSVGLTGGLTGCSEDFETGDCLNLSNKEVKVTDCDSGDADVKVGCGDTLDKEGESLITIHRNGNSDQICVTDV